MGNFYKAVLPTLLISILFGTLGIVTHKTPNSTRLSTHWLPKIITLACLVIYTYAVVATLLDTNSQYISGSYYGTASSNIGAIASFLGQIAATYVILGFNFMYNSTIKTSLENIQRIDNKFEYAGHKLSYRNFYILQLTTITTGAIILMLLFFNLHLGSGKFTTAKEIIMQFPHIVMFLVEIQFSVFVWLVYCRILFVNDIIDNLTAIESSTGITFEGAVTTSKYVKKNIGVFDEYCLTDIIPLKWKEYSIQHIINKIHLLMEIHSSLNDVALLLNKSFEFQILVCITIQFIRIVFSTFYSYYFKVVISNSINHSTYENIITQFSDYAKQHTCTAVCSADFIRYRNSYLLHSNMSFDIQAGYYY